MTDAVETSSNKIRAQKAVSEFIPKTSWWILLLTSFVLFTLPWIAIVDFKYSTILVYVLPFFLSALSVFRGIKISDRINASLAREIKRRYKLSSTDTKKITSTFALEIPNANAIVFVILFLYMTAMFQWDIISDRSYFDGKWHTIVGNVFLSLLFTGMALLFAIAPIFAIQDNSSTIIIEDSVEEIRTVNLRPSERNDIELISIEVELGMSAKRVDAYTLESTLLSALAFSALIAIMYSDKYDLSNHLDTNLSCAKPTYSNIYNCVSSVALHPSENNIKIYICLFLLACSVCFLSVLVARLRFTESFRHSEELLKITQKVNERENALEPSNPAGAETLTAEIERLMKKLRTGAIYLRPMMRFIKLFRDAGIFFFIFAIATCGWYFWPWMPILILAIFSLAAAYTFADKIWQQTGFIPLLRSTLSGLASKRHH